MDGLIREPGPDNGDVAPRPASPDKKPGDGIGGKNNCPFGKATGEGSVGVRVMT